MHDSIVRDDVVGYRRALVSLDVWFGGELNLTTAVALAGPQQRRSNNAGGAVLRRWNRWAQTG